MRNNPNLDPDEAESLQAMGAIFSIAAIVAGVWVVGKLPRGPGLMAGSGLVLLLFIQIAGRSRHMGKRAGQPSAKVAQELDGRAPVLFLRPFDQDGKGASEEDHSSWNWFSMPVLPQTEEAMIVRSLVRIGPVIATGRPGEVLPPVGASRWYPEDESWQEEVLATMKRAALVVAWPGGSPGISWELEQCGLLLDQIPVLLILDPSGDETGQVTFAGCTVVTKENTLAILFRPGLAPHPMVLHANLWSVCSLLLGRYSPYSSALRRLPQLLGRTD